MTYYEGKLKIAEEKSHLIEQGFILKAREIANALSICPKEDLKAIAEQLNLAVEAIAEVDREVDRDVIFYREQVELEKGV